MSIAAADLQELFLPLIEGAFDTPQWGGFLRHLMRRSLARRAMLVVSALDANSPQEPLVIEARAPRATADPPLDHRELGRLELHAGRPLRSGRVYSRDELLDFDRADVLTRQRAQLADLGINFGRWMRVTAGSLEASLVLVREHEDFSAAAAALIASTAAPLSAALRLRAVHHQQQIGAAMAGLALGRLGVAQIGFDRQARVLEIDKAARGLLPVVQDPSGQVRLQLGAEASRALSAACAALWSSDPGECRLVALNLEKAPHLLLHRTETGNSGESAVPLLVGSLRLTASQAPSSRSAAQILTQTHGLSHREAELALAIAHGQSIAEAAAEMGLTIETARNYSKIIYAKTTSRGQTDLARLIHTGLAPLA